MVNEGRPSPGLAHSGFKTFQQNQRMFPAAKRGEDPRGKREQNDIRATDFAYDPLWQARKPRILVGRAWPAGAAPRLPDGLVAIFARVLIVVASVSPRGAGFAFGGIPGAAATEGCGLDGVVEQRRLADMQYRRSRLSIVRARRGECPVGFWVSPPVHPDECPQQRADTGSRGAWKRRKRETAGMAIVSPRQVSAATHVSEMR